MKLLLLDTETTGFAPNTDSIIELGLALYDTQLKEVLWQYSTIIYTDKSNEAADINKISQDVINVSKDLPSSKNPVQPIIDLVEANMVDVVVAHNSDFDKSFLTAQFGILCFNTTPPKPIPWVCSKSDLIFPKKSPSSKLSHIAIDHSIPVGRLHRALSDVQLLAELLKEISNLDEQINLALQPRAIFKSLTSFQQKDLPKQAGFSWDPVKKYWWKKLDPNTSTDPTSDRPFKIQRVG